MPKPESRLRPGYRTITLPSFPKARLLALELADGEIIGIGVHHGLPEGSLRIMQAHGEWTLAHAALHAVRENADALQGMLKELGGNPRTMEFSQLASRAARRRIEGKLIASLLVPEDGYRSTRAIEAEYRVDGNDALYRAVSAIAARAVEISTTDEARIAGARRLRDASPGPATALRRMQATIEGKPVPDDAIHSMAPKDDAPEKRTTCLGSILVEPDADRLARDPGGPVEITVLASLDPEGMEFDDTGAISFASLDLKLAYDPATWDTSMDGSLYGDWNVQDAVNALLERRGIFGMASWSERGRQSPESGDMDVSYGLAEALWPEAVAEARASHAAAPAPGAS